MALDKKVAKLALSIVARLKKAKAEHQYGDEYCIHGTYVGWWGGPDYMCGYCEDGISIYEYALMGAREKIRKDSKYGRRTLGMEFIKGIQEMDGYDYLSEDAQRSLWTHLAQWIREKD